MKKKIFVGLSGGVDSAVSAAILKKQGHEVTGVFIRIVLPGYPCTAIVDRQDAMRVAAHLRIPFVEIDLSDAYAKKVFALMLEEFKKGHTPNPDVLCNREIKFGLFYEYARALGADAIATGHYARIQKKGDALELLTGKDAAKDQSYFLWMIGENQLQNTFFPIGGLEKSRVRILAQQFNLPNATRKDSQGLCFLGDISMYDMLSRELHNVSGNVVDEKGTIVGSHEGAVLYTLGQRHGFTVTGESGLEKNRLYVVGKDIEYNTITVSSNAVPTKAHSTLVELRDCNTIGRTVRGEVMLRYRYRQKLLAGIFDPEKKSIRIKEARYVPIGQSIVLYVGERCVGGGIVDKSTVVE